MNPRAERMRKRLNVPMLIVAALVIPQLVLEELKLGEPWDTIAQVMNWAIWLAFVGEMVAMLAVVSSKREYLRRHPLDVAIIVLSPPVLPPALASIRVLRLLRLIRVFRLVPASRQVFSVTGVKYAFLLVMVVLVGGGLAYSEAEHYSIAEGFYWALTTMTTVGNPFTPKNTTGYVLTAAVTSVGLAFVALLTGALAQAFLKPEIEDMGDRVEEAVAVETAQAEAQLEQHAERDLVARCATLADQHRDLAAQLDDLQRALAARVAR